MVRGLDEDESKFLDEVSRQQALIEKQRHEEDLKELNEYRISLTPQGWSSFLSGGFWEASFSFLSCLEHTSCRPLPDAASEWLSCALAGRAGLTEALLEIFHDFPL